MNEKALAYILALIALIIIMGVILPWIAKKI